MDQEALLLKAKRADAILGDPTLMGFIEELKSDLLAGMVATSPDQKEARELLYFQHLGLQNLIAYLQTYSAAAASIEQLKPEID